jgi:hypothetical protein
LISLTGTKAMLSDISPFPNLPLSARPFGMRFDNHTLEVLDLKTGRQTHTIPA